MISKFNLQIYLSHVLSTKVVAIDRCPSESLPNRGSARNLTATSARACFFGVSSFPVAHSSVCGGLGIGREIAKAR